MGGTWDAFLGLLRPLICEMNLSLRLRCGPCRVFMAKHDEPLPNPSFIKVDLGVWFLDYDNEAEQLAELFTCDNLVKCLAAQLSAGGPLSPGAMAIVDLSTVDWSNCASDLNQRASHIAVVLVGSGALYHCCWRLLQRVEELNLTQSDTSRRILTLALWTPFSCSAGDIANVAPQICTTVLAIIHFEAAVFAAESDCGPVSRLVMARRATHGILDAFASTQQFVASLPLHLLRQLLRPDFAQLLEHRTFFETSELTAAVRWLTIQTGSSLQALLPGLTTSKSTSSSTTTTTTTTTTPPPFISSFPPLSEGLTSLIQRHAGMMLSWVLRNCRQNGRSLRKMLSDDPKALLTLLTLAQLGAVQLHRHFRARDLVLEPDSGKDLQGATGVVRFGTVSSPSGRSQVAVKFFKPDVLENASQRRDVLTELALLASLSHPNIVFIYGANIKKPRRAFMIMERADRDLHDLLQSPSTEVSQTSALHMAKDVLSALAFLHSVSITHRDLKPKNCLVFTSGSFHSVKLCDFGSGKQTVEDAAWSKGVGTVTFMAPEVLKGDKRLSSKVDIYSFGLILFQLLTRKVPFDDLEQVTIPHRIISGVRPKIPSTCPKPLKKLIELCWHPSPKRRPAAAHVLTALADFPTA